MKEWWSMVAGGRNVDRHDGAVDNDSRQEGFTLIELTMSLVFIAFIIVFLTTTMLDIMKTYNKGIWMNQINSAGRQINADITDQARFTKNKITIHKDAQRFCIGGVTYMWNTEEQVAENNPKNWYKGNKANTKLRFVRVLDSGGKYCTKDVNEDKMPGISDKDVTALLGPGIVVNEFTVKEGATGLLRVDAVFSTEYDTIGKVNGTGNWRCGQVIGGVFKEGQNQFCAFAEFNIITYRRLGE